MLLEMDHFLSNCLKGHTIMDTLKYPPFSQVYVRLQSPQHTSQSF